MSDEQKRLGRKWLNWGSALVIAAAAYQGTHYATAAINHDPEWCCPCYKHAIGGSEVPDWVESYFFWPAHAFDHLIGVHPWRWR